MRHARTLLRLATMVLAIFLFIVIVWVYNRQLGGAAGRTIGETLSSSIRLALIIGGPAVLLFTAVIAAANRRRRD